MGMGPQVCGEHGGARGDVTGDRRNGFDGPSIALPQSKKCVQCINWKDGARLSSRINMVLHMCYGINESGSSYGCA